MKSRIRTYFAQFERADWEIIGYFILILCMMGLVPIIFFWDYVQTFEFYWRALLFKKTLTESLQNWWVWILDNWLVAW